MYLFRVCTSHEAVTAAQLQRLAPEANEGRGGLSVTHRVPLVHHRAKTECELTHRIPGEARAEKMLLNVGFPKSFEETLEQKVQRALTMSALFGPEEWSLSKLRLSGNWFLHTNKWSHPCLKNDYMGGELCLPQHLTFSQPIKNKRLSGEKEHSCVSNCLHWSPSIIWLTPVIIWAEIIQIIWCVRSIKRTKIQRNVQVVLLCQFILFCFMIESNWFLFFYVLWFLTSCFILKILSFLFLASLCSPYPDV